VSDYTDFALDFPDRCRKLLVEFTDAASEKNCEVTLLLMATMAGFVVPYERLSYGTKIKQPPLDRDNYLSASNKLKTELQKPIEESQFFDQGSIRWHGDSLISAFGTPNDWPEIRRPALLSQGTTVIDVLSRLRHAFAHGNVLTKRDGEEQISHLVFVSGGTCPNGNVIPTGFLLITPSQLRAFLDKWFAFVAGLGLKHGEVLAAIDMDE